MHLFACLFGAGAGTATIPNRDRFYYDPYVTFNRGWGIHPDGFNNWLFGESSGIPNADTQDPNAVTFREKRIVLRNLHVESSQDGTLYIRNWANGTTAANQEIHAIIPIKAGVTLDIPFGIDGVRLGTGPYLEYVAAARSTNRLYLDVTYDAS